MHFDFNLTHVRCWPWCTEIMLMYHLFLLIVLQCLWYVIRRLAYLQKCYQAFPFLLGMSQEKQSVWCMKNSSCRLQWPKHANNGAFQSKCVICLHRRESGLNTDTDSAHTPHISRAEILTHIEAVFTALSSSFWIELDKQSTDRHFLCEYSDERDRFRVNSRALPETGKAIKSPHLIARGNQNHIS